MVDTEETTTMARSPQLRRSGYVAAIVVNAIMMVIANNVLEWGWPPFLTEDFADLLWLINLSLGATILVNVVYMSFDPPWFKSLTRVGLNLISIVVVSRTLQVFPFDFSAYEFQWATLIRVALVIGIVGTGIAIIVELIKLVGALGSPRETVTR